MGLQILPQYPGPMRTGQLIDKATTLLERIEIMTASNAHVRCKMIWTGLNKQRICVIPYTRAKISVLNVRPLAGSACTVKPVEGAPPSVYDWTTTVNWPAISRTNCHLSHKRWPEEHHGCIRAPSRLESHSHSCQVRQWLPDGRSAREDC